MVPYVPGIVNDLFVYGHAVLPGFVLDKLGLLMATLDCLDWGLTIVFDGPILLLLMWRHLFPKNFVMVSLLVPVLCYYFGRRVFNAVYNWFTTDTGTQCSMLPGFPRITKLCASCENYGCIGYQRTYGINARHDGLLSHWNQFLDLVLVDWQDGQDIYDEYSLPHELLCAACEEMCAFGQLCPGCHELLGTCDLLVHNPANGGDDHFIDHMDCFELHTKHCTKWSQMHWVACAQS
jgi:hypothetical protein